MRLRNINNARTILEQHPDLIILEPKQHKGQWKKICENQYPIHLEIGTGKGQFINTISDQIKNINFLSMEKYDSVILRALQKLIDSSSKNVFLLRGEAENLLEYFTTNEIERIYLNFSDPWPKKRNAKRRLTHCRFLEKYHQILGPNGEIHIKTDNRAFFEFTLQHLNEHGMVFDHLNLDLHADEPESNVRSEYEESKAARGSRIYQLVCRFKANGHEKPDTGWHGE